MNNLVTTLICSISTRTLYWFDASSVVQINKKGEAASRNPECLCDHKLCAHPKALPQPCKGTTLKTAKEELKTAKKSGDQDDIDMAKASAKSAQAGVERSMTKLLA